MKSISLTPLTFVLVVVIGIHVGLFSNGRDALGQIPLPNLLNPKGDDQQDSGDGPTSLALSGLNAIASGKSESELTKHSKSAKAFEEVFESIAASARQSLVRIKSTRRASNSKSRRRQIALGTVVGSDGLVLTKASELKGTLYCEVASGEAYRADIIGLDNENDLALLKIDTENLSVGNWATTDEVTGDWIATPLDHKDDLATGVVSVDTRKIPASMPFIGIFMNDIESAGVEVLNVQKDSPADKGGLKAEDIILKMDDFVTKDIADLRERLKQFDAGDLVTLTIERKGKRRKLKLTLAERDKVSAANMRSNQQNSMGSRLSSRRKDFPVAFQHDTGLQANQCGGPVVNLDGQIVGINIARSGRVSSLTIPISRILPVVETLRTGEFSPAIVNAERIERVEAQIEDTKKLSKELADKIDQLEQAKEFAAQKKAGLELAAKDIKKRLREMVAEMKKQDEAVENVDEEIERLERLIRDLAKDKKRLATGLKY